MPKDQVLGVRGHSRLVGFKKRAGPQKNRLTVWLLDGLAQAHLGERSFEKLNLLNWLLALGNLLRRCAV